ncbi:MAG: hypothetical protein JMDDDDMK_04967 [Acidobacteria bacterium]|nr:hypothetical protein [Acidobacteriota bacterium]
MKAWIIGVASKQRQGRRKMATRAVWHATSQSGPSAKGLGVSGEIGYIGATRDMNEGFGW